jgi:hypothetical protein
VTAIVAAQLGVNDLGREFSYGGIVGEIVEVTHCERFDGKRQVKVTVHGEGFATIITLDPSSVVTQS